MSRYRCDLFFFFNDTATTEIYTLSLHDALPISSRSEQTRKPSSWRSSGRDCAIRCVRISSATCRSGSCSRAASTPRCLRRRSEEHTSELQSQSNLVCRLLLENKNKLVTRAHTCR